MHFNKLLVETFWLVLTCGTLAHFSHVNCSATNSFLECSFTYLLDHSVKYEDWPGKLFDGKGGCKYLSILFMVRVRLPPPGYQDHGPTCGNICFYLSIGLSFC